MQKRVAGNVRITLVNVLFSGVMLFILYRYLLETIGIEKIGVWSVVLATTSVSNIGGLGLSGSVVKFVAKYIANGSFVTAVEVIETAVLSVGIIIAIILMVAYFPLSLLLEYFISSTDLPSALVIFPYAMISLWLTSVAGVCQSGLEGCQRFDIAGFLNMVLGGIYFLLAIVLVPSYGLLGLAYAQVIQASMLVLSLWIFLRCEFSLLPFAPYRWKKKLFMEMLRYGVNFQLASVLSLLFEPVTKLLLSKFGNLGMVGYFEMANRMVMQFRLLLVAANKVLVPVIATFHENTPHRVKEIYLSSYRLLIYLALPLYIGIIAVSPAISELWIGRYEKDFVVFSILLSVGWFINTLVGPSYMGNLGSGNLRWNTVYHLISGVLNALLGVVFGLLYGGNGVVMAFVNSIVVASSVLVFAYQSEHDISLRKLFPRENIWLVLSAIIGVILTWLFFLYIREYLEASLMFISCIMVFVATVSSASWRHPMRPKIVSWICSK